jgi:hypothetical protein
MRIEKGREKVWGENVRWSEDEFQRIASQKDVGKPRVGSPRFEDGSGAGGIGGRVGLVREVVGENLDKEKLRLMAEIDSIDYAQSKLLSDVQGNGGITQSQAPGLMNSELRDMNVSCTTNELLYGGASETNFESGPQLKPSTESRAGNDSKTVSSNQETDGPLFIMKEIPEEQIEESLLQSQPQPQSQSQPQPQTLAQSQTQTQSQKFKKKDTQASFQPPPPHPRHLPPHPSHLPPNGQPTQCQGLHPAAPNGQPAQCPRLEPSNRRNWSNVFGHKK